MQLPPPLPLLLARLRDHHLEGAAGGAQWISGVLTSSVTLPLSQPACSTCVLCLAPGLMALVSASVIFNLPSLCDKACCHECLSGVSSPSATVP
jgi:hypothetical protein